jgi:hypothetical protein
VHPRAGPASPRGGADPGANLTAISTTVLANGTTLPGNYYAPQALYLQLGTFDTRTGSVDLADPQYQEIVSLNSTGWRSEYWYNTPAGGNPALEGASNPRTGLSYFPEFNPSFYDGTMVVVNDSTGRYAHNYSLGQGAEFEGVSVGNNGTVLYATCTTGCSGMGGGGELIAMNISSRQRLDSVPAVQHSGYALFENGSDQVFVADGSDDNVSIFNAADASNLSYAGHLRCTGADSLAYDARDGLMFLACPGHNWTVAVNVTNDSVAFRAPSLPGAVSIAYDSQDGFIEEANGSSVVALRAANGTPVWRDTDMHTSTTTLLYDPDGSQTVLAEDDGEVLVLSALNGTIERRLWVGGVDVNGFAFDPERNQTFAGMTGGNSNLLEFNGTTGQIGLAEELNQTPYSLVYDPALSAMVGWTGSGLVAFNDTSGAVVRTGGLPPGAASEGLTVGLFDSTDDTLVYANGTGAVLVVGATNLTTIATFPFTNLTLYNAPNIALDSRLDELVLSNVWDHSVTLVDLRNDSVIGEVTVSSSNCFPGPVAVDPATDIVYAADQLCADLSAYNLSSRSQAGSISLATPGADVIFDTGLGALLATGTSYGLVYVAYPGSGANPYKAVVGDWPTLLRYDPSTQAVFVFDSLNGTVTTLMPAITGAELTASPSTTVDSNTTVTLRAVSVGGVPPNHYWYSGLPAGCTTENAPKIECVPVEAGSYSIQVDVNDSVGQSVSAALAITVVPHVAIESFEASPANVTVDENVTLTTNASGGWGYLNYNYSGLPPGCANDDSPTLLCAPTEVGGFYVGVFVSDAQGANATTTLLVLVGSLRFGVQVAESGLPPGTPWGVELGATSTRGTASNLSTSLQNGTYSYAVDLVPGYHATAGRGTVVVDGGPAELNLTFRPFTFNLTFVDTGAPAGSGWSVAVENRSWNASSSSLSVPLSNGTWVYRVVPPTGDVASPANGSARVANASSTVDIDFSAAPSPVFSIRFNEFGLPSTLIWSVELSGVVVSNNASAILFTDANGSYGWRIGAPAGWSAQPAFGNVSVAGHPVTVTVRFALVADGESPALGSIPLEWLLPAAAAGLVAVAAALAYRLRRRRGRLPGPPRS